MNYLVVHNRNGRVGITIEPAGKVYSHPITCWAVSDGKQVKFVQFQMHKLLAPYHFAGAYQTFAHYAMDYDDLVALITHHMGPDDRARCENLQVAMAEAQRSLEEGRRIQTIEHRHMVFHVGFMVLGFLWIVFKAAVKCLTILMLVPLLIRWLHKKRGS
jgi:hypothetical protein